MCLCYIKLICSYKVYVWFIGMYIIINMTCVLPTTSSRGRLPGAAGSSGTVFFSARTLGGTTCLTLLVKYGLICFLRHHLSNTAN